MTPEEIETELIRIDAEYIKCSTTDYITSEKLAKELDELYESITYEQFDYLSDEANSILDAYGYEDSLPLHEGWD